MGLFGKKWQSQEEWEETSVGKKFMDKIRAAKEETDRKQAEWEEKADPERVAQYKIWKKVFPCIYVPYSLLLIAGIKFGLWPWLLAAGVAGLVFTVVLFFYPPKNVRYRSVFLISALAIVCSVLIALVCSIGEIKEKIEQKKLERQVAEQTLESDEKSKEEYESFLKNEVIDEGDELYDFRAAGASASEDKGGK